MSYDHNIRVCLRCDHAVRGRTACDADPAGTEPRLHAERGTCPLKVHLPVVNPPPWSPSQPSRGVGDTIAKITSAMGMTPCGGCKERQEALNEKFPYGK